MTRRIDSHHHLWGQPGDAYPWMTDELARIRRPFGMTDLEPALAAAGIDGTVVVQARTDLDETRELLALTEASPALLGVVGWVDLVDPAVAATLSELRAGPTGQRLVAIRHPVQGEPDPDWLDRPDVRRGIGAVGAAGLAYDLLISPRELPAALRLVRDLPDVRFVVDHVAKPEVASGGWEPWASRLSAMGREPNVDCKLSGLVTEAVWDGWTVDQLRPYADLALDAFGPARVLYGSDWPVCLLAGSYADVAGAAEGWIAGLTATEQSRVMGGTAERVYRLPS